MWWMAIPAAISALGSLAKMEKSNPGGGKGGTGGMNFGIQQSTSVNNTTETVQALSFNPQISVVSPDAVQYPSSQVVSPTQSTDQSERSGNLPDVYSDGVGGVGTIPNDQLEGEGVISDNMIYIFIALAAAVAYYYYK